MVDPHRLDDLAYLCQCLGGASRGLKAADGKVDTLREVMSDAVKFDLIHTKPYAIPHEWRSRFNDLMIKLTGVAAMGGSGKLLTGIAMMPEAEVLRAAAEIQEMAKLAEQAYDDYAGPD